MIWDLEDSHLNAEIKDNDLVLFVLDDENKLLDLKRSKNDLHDAAFYRLTKKYDLNGQPNEYGLEDMLKHLSIQKRLVYVGKPGSEEVSNFIYRKILLEEDENYKNTKLNTVKSISEIICQTCNSLTLKEIIAKGIGEVEGTEKPITENIPARHPLNLKRLYVRKYQQKNSLDSFNSDSPERYAAERIKTNLAEVATNVAFLGEKENGITYEKKVMVAYEMIKWYAENKRVELPLCNSISLYPYDSSVPISADDFAAVIRQSKGGGLAINCHLRSRAIEEYDCFERILDGIKIGKLHEKICIIWCCDETIKGNFEEYKRQTGCTCYEHEVDFLVDGRLSKIEGERIKKYADNYKGVISDDVIKKATVKIEATIGAYQLSGSGFVISDDGLVLTCHHCVYVSGKSFAKYINVSNDIFDMKAEFVFDAPDVDLCVYRLRPGVAEGKKYLQLPIDEKTNICETDTVYVSGYSESGPYEIMPVSISNARKYMVNFDVPEGFSGAPVLSSSKGGVIGVYYKEKTFLPIEKFWERLVKYV